MDQCATNISSRGGAEAQRDALGKWTWDGTGGRKGGGWKGRNGSRRGAVGRDGKTELPIAASRAVSL